MMEGGNIDQEVARSDLSPKNVKISYTVHMPTNGKIKLHLDVLLATAIHNGWKGLMKKQKHFNSHRA